MISFLYQVAMQTKRIAVYVANSTRLPYLDVRLTSIKWIPRQTADFIQHPHPTFHGPHFMYHTFVLCHTFVLQLSVAAKYGCK